MGKSSKLTNKKTMETLKQIGIGALAVGAVAAGLFVAASYGLIFQDYFAPRFENVRLKTFENSQSYNDGMVQQLQSYYIEYQKSDKAGKDAIRSVISRQYANYPVYRLPAHLQSFVSAALNPYPTEIK